MVRVWGDPLALQHGQGLWTLQEGRLIPYKSEKQRKYLHAKEPKLAAKWDKKYGGKVVKKQPKKGK